MNPSGVATLVLAVVAFFVAMLPLRPRPRRVRLTWLLALSVLSLPGLWFASYYLHVLPKKAWFYTLWSWTGTELLGATVGAAAGAAAAFLPRWLLGLPLVAMLPVVAVPHLKPWLRPLPDEAFRERTKGDDCLQSTVSTCGPAGAATILRHLGHWTDERTVARAAFTSATGTEAWYLARHVRKCGFVPEFAFAEGFAPEFGQPALVGVRITGVGHFIAVLAVENGAVTYVEPLQGRNTLPLAEFRQKYDFTGFHMVVHRPPAH